MSLPRSTAVLTSIHDVTPAHESHVRALWAHCRSAGVTPALFVVPNWHGSWKLADHPRFVSWLQQCVELGADVLLHGERHDEVGTRRSLRQHASAIGRTAAEGEFLTLDAWQARERIECGVLYLWSLELRPIGFVPPAWLAPANTHRVVRDVGLDISEDASHVHVHRTAAGPSARMHAPAIRWSSRTRWRAQASRAMARCHWYLSRHEKLVRLALHPQDLQSRVTARSVHRAIRDWTTAASPLHYRDLAAH